MILSTVIRPLFKLNRLFLPKITKQGGVRSFCTNQHQNSTKSLYDKRRLRHVGLNANDLKWVALDRTNAFNWQQNDKSRDFPWPALDPNFPLMFHS